MAPQQPAGSTSGGPTSVDELRRNLQQAQQELLALKAAAHSRFKLEKPEKFNGERGKLRGFLTQLRSYLLYCAAELPNDYDKVLCASSLLTGTVLAWFEPIMRDYLLNENHNYRNDDTNRIFGSYDNFEEALKGAFGDPNEERSNEQRLENLRQVGSASQYAAAF